MYLLMIVFSASLLFYLLFLGGSLLETRGFMPAELLPFQHLLGAIFARAMDFVTYILAYFK